MGIDKADLTISYLADLMWRGIVNGFFAGGKENTFGLCKVGGSFEGDAVTWV